MRTATYKGDMGPLDTLRYALDRAGDALLRYTRLNGWGWLIKLIGALVLLLFFLIGFIAESRRAYGEEHKHNPTCVSSGNTRPCCLEYAPPPHGNTCLSWGKKETLVCMCACGWTGSADSDCGPP